MNPWVFLCLRYSKYQNVSHRARLNFRWGYSYMGLLGLTCGSQTPRRNVKVKRNFYSDFQTSCYFFLSQQQHIANYDKRLNRSCAFLQRDHPFTTYATFSIKLTCCTPSYANVCMRIRG